MRLIFFLIISMSSYISFSQKKGTIEVKKSKNTSYNEMKIDTSSIFVVTEKMPEFPGGDQALYEFLSKNVKYPDSALVRGESGTVYLQFIVEVDGTVTSPFVARGVNKELDREALMVLSKMPKWIPGEQRGIPVKVRYTLPIKFELK